MAKIRIVGDSSGYVELAAPNAAGNNTLELPSNATKLVGADASNSLNVTGIATFSSGIVVSAGSTAAPSISPSGDSNTGIFFPSADTVCIGEGGTEVLRVNSSGYVGVGTTNPQQILHLSASSPNILLQGSNFPALKYAGTDGVVDAEMYYGAGGGNDLVVHNYNSGPIIFNTNSIERLRIDSSGRVTMPYQPAFMVRCDSAGTIGGGTKLGFTSVVGGQTAQVVYDRLGNWSDANDRFTAPVAGVYQFIMGIYFQLGSGAYGSIAPRLNGSQMTIGDNFIFFTGTPGSVSNTDMGVYGSWYMNLAVGDYVEIYTRTGANTVTIYTGHTFFGGNLVG